MRQITVKYSGECRKCGTTLDVGSGAIYERYIGIFCPPCAPTDTEDIREYRQEAADRKADKYEGWVTKHREKAEAQLNSCPEIRHDIAFITQPGRIPFRDRMNRADDRAFESLQVAEKMEAKAESLRHVRVKGDSAKRHQEMRDMIRPNIKTGMRIDTWIYGEGVVKRVNKKSVTMKTIGEFETLVNVDLAYIKPVEITN